jgi:hypothetical protein
MCVGSDLSTCKRAKSVHIWAEDPVIHAAVASSWTCRYNHGLQTMYEFAEDVGGLDRSRYFGYPKDLYHFDHFMGVLQHPCIGCIGCF